MEIVLSILGGSATVAIIEGIKEALTWHRNRKAQKEDKAEDRAEKKTEERIAQLETDVAEIKKLATALAESQKNILWDRILCLARQYTAAGEIDFDDRCALNALYASYHFGLGGNGDLDELMEQVRKLPLKLKK